MGLFTLEPKDMTASYEVRWYGPRSEDRGQELETDERHGRPNIVVSRQYLHDVKLAITVAIRTGRKRFQLSTSPPLKKLSGPDFQVIWTLPHDRDITKKRHEDVRKLNDSSIQLVRRALKKRLVPVEVVNSNDLADAVGKVVFVELAQGTRQHEQTDGDMFTIQRDLKTRFDIDWPGAPTHLPCVVICNQLSQHSGSYLKLATVVPLLNIPELLEMPEAPKVLVPGTTDKLAALTACLMSVSSNESDSRMVTESGSLSSWMVSNDELWNILREVASWLNLQLP